MALLLSLPIPPSRLISVILVSGSLFLCLFTYGYGLLFRVLESPDKRLPPLPLYPDSAFPTVWDRAFTLLYSTAYGAMTILGLYTAEPGHTTEINVWVMLFTLLLYVPMIIRLGLLKRPVIPAGTLWKAPIAILIALCILFVFCNVVDFLKLPEYIVRNTGSPLEQDVIESFRTGSCYCKICVAISACIIAPIGEECFFRGFLYNVLKRNGGIVAAALCSSLFFGAIHCALVQLIALIFFGLIQCYLYERFRTLWVPMAFHAVFNGLSLTFAYVLSS